VKRDKVSDEIYTKHLILAVLVMAHLVAAISNPVLFFSLIATFFILYAPLLFYFMLTAFNALSSYFSLEEKGYKLAILSFLLVIMLMVIGAFINHASQYVIIAVISVSGFYSCCSVIFFVSRFWSDQEGDQ